MMPLRLFQKFVHPHRLTGSVMEVALSDASVGDICDVRGHWRDSEVVARAQVIGFRNEMTLLSLLGNARGISRESVVIPTGHTLTVPVGDSMLGAVVNAGGTVVSRFSLQRADVHVERWCELNANPPPFDQRVPIRNIFYTGIRAIDGMLACGVGQRLGIFAAAGSGKTSLVSMLLEHASADVFVVGLIGERGREVAEFVDEIKKSSRRDRSVVVYATSDASSVDRCNAALLATTIAEYYRDQGCNVLLVQDSLTRYVRALRDVALAAGEPPARRGFPASVFEALPRLIERPGITTSGSITAFYTVLLESDDEIDPIAEEIRSLLDGHIYLSRKLAARNHYPAIDVLGSLSRIAAQICSEQQMQAAGVLREKIGRLEELQMMADLGEYRAGENSENDNLLAQKQNIVDWLRQAPAESSDTAETLHEMYDLVC